GTPIPVVLRFSPTTPGAPQGAVVAHRRPGRPRRRAESVHHSPLRPVPAGQHRRGTGKRVLYARERAKRRCPRGLGGEDRAERVRGVAALLQWREGRLERGARWPEATVEQRADGR